MQRKDLALRVLSTAAIMSIVTSIAAPAFADIYYIGNGSIDVETITSTDGKQQYVKVTQGGKTYTDRSNEIVIKDGNNEGNAAQKEENRIDGKKAKVAVPDNERTDTQELEAASTADAAGPAAGESQLDPDDAFTLSEEEEDSEEGKDPTDNPTENPTENSTDNPTEKPTENPTDDPTANSKKDVVYQYDPADPDSEQQATKPTLSASAAPAAKTPETTLADAPATTAPAEGSAKKPTTNVIRVINDWVGKVLNIRLSNVNIKVDDTSRYADGRQDYCTNGKYGVSAAEVQGTGNTKIELDGQNLLDSSTSEYWAGLNKKDSGNLTITDETSDKGETITAKDERDTSGSLRAEGGIYDGAAIGGSVGQDTDNITIEGYATVKANTLGHDEAGIGGGDGAKGSNITIQGHANVTANGGETGAGIGGGGKNGSYGGDAENITIRDYAKVTATGQNGAAIGGGSAGSHGSSGNANHIVIQGHATVVAKGAATAIGAEWGDNVDVTIGTEGATAEKEDVHVTAIGLYGSAIGNGRKKTEVTIQGHTTIWTASGHKDTAIGSDKGNVTVTIKDNVTIDPDDATVNAYPTSAGTAIGGGYIDSSLGRTVEVNIDGGENGTVKLGVNSALRGGSGAISGTKVKIGNNVLLKMKQKRSGNRYIAVNNAEVAVGTRSNPAAGGLVNTIGDNTELWYLNEDNRPQKIVHGKNVCAHVPGKVVKKVDATCTEDGWVEYECNYEHENGAPGNSCGRTWKVPIPALGHHWKDNGDGTHTCPDCGATETLPVNTNSALELRVVDAEGMDQPFTVNQNGTLRTYTGAYDTATLTGDLDTLRYLQEHGAQTIQFVTNGQTSSFAINDLLAQGSGSEVFYLTHRGAEEPTLLLVEADHSELVKD